jgi:hypothetical protein
MTTASILLFIDPQIDHYFQLVQGALPEAEVIILDPTQDGIQQISNTLATRSGIDSLQIFSHGSEARLQLGTADLDSDRLTTSAAAICQWGDALTADAEILLYGCHLAAGEVGKWFVQHLSQLTHATVAASENLTGCAALGGDWELAYQTGQVKRGMAIAPEALAAYPGILQNFTVANASQLAAAISAANVNGENDTITLNGDINLSTALPEIDLTDGGSLEFIGNSRTVSGSNLVRVFYVQSGTVRFNELTIANGRATGAAGTDQNSALSGGNGSNGQGGGLYIDGGNVTTVNVSFNDNRAVGGRGGNSLQGSGGKGGDGQGGAVFVNSGSLRLSTTSFAGNIAEKGTGGSAPPNLTGTSGIARGGAIFVNNAAGTVISEGAPLYSTSRVNRASNDNDTNFRTDNAFGTVTTVTPPIAAAIARADLNPTASALVNYTVTFSQDVTGVDINDFSLTTTGITDAAIDSVTGSGRVYTVGVRTGTGSTGTIRLDIVDDDTIQTGGTPLGGTGIDNGKKPGEDYTVNRIPPNVLTSDRKSTEALTAATSIWFTVTFDSDVDGVDPTDFALATTGNITGATVNAVTQVSQTVYEVEVKTGTGNGDIGLNLADNDSIVSDDTRRLALGGVGLVNGNFTGATYTVDKTPPVVSNIVRNDAETLNAASVSYTVTFSQNVTGVDAADFTLATSGVTGASVTSVVARDAKTYTVTVNMGSGDGVIGLNLVDNDSVLNTLGIVLGGAGASNGNFVGDSYRVDRTLPTVDIIDVSPKTRSNRVDAITIKFAEAVSGFDIGDLQLTRNGENTPLKGAGLTTEDGITWTLTNTKKLTNRRGDYSLSITASNAGIFDVVGNPLTANVSDRWTNLISVNADDPGINRLGTKRSDILRGTENADTLRGLKGNDRIEGLDSGDVLIGNSGNDTLVGSDGQDRMNGGSGADRFVFSGATQAQALASSRVDMPDLIQGFQAAKGDRFQLDFDQNGKTSDRPSRLFNAGKVRGNSLDNAVKAAYGDRDQTSLRNHQLAVNQAVMLNWRGQTYMSVNDGSVGFSADQDLVVAASGFRFKPGNMTMGKLAVKSYFA